MENSFFIFRLNTYQFFQGAIGLFLLFSAGIATAQDEPHAKLSDNLDGEVYYLIDNKLYFVYDEEYSSTTIKYNIYNKKHIAYLTEQDQALTPSFGDNRFVLDFSSNGCCCLSERVNILEIINEKGEKSYLRFKQTGAICLGSN